jgi:hypothetical protein
VVPRRTASRRGRMLAIGQPSVLGLTEGRVLPAAITSGGRQIPSRLRRSSQSRVSKSEDN